jgi:NADPH:quinone reductase-like Zn-dependent oxidoreductase
MSSSTTTTTTATAIPSTIRAVMQPDSETTDLILTEIPIQHAQDGTEEHLIKVYATSPCAGELYWAKNFPAMMAPDKIGVPCYDLSGVVESSPADSPFQPGTEIYARTMAGRTGNAREYTIAITSELARKPKNLTWGEAASIPLSALTAYQALFEHGSLKVGWKDESWRVENSKKRVLITAAAGGVGVWVVQLAKLAGVEDIVALVGPDNVDFIRGLGATEVINYKQQSLGEWAALGNRKVDLVVDMLGKNTLADAWTAVEEGGTLLSVSEPPENQRPLANVSKNVANSFFIMEPKGWQLDDLTELLEQQLIWPTVDSTYKLNDFKAAFAKVASGHARGKVIIEVM